MTISLPQFSFAIVFLLGSTLSCATTAKSSKTAAAKYSGTASVTQGRAKTTVSNLFPSGGRVAGVGVIKASDDSSWIVPADVNFTNNSFAVAPDLYNPHGKKHGSAAKALASFNPADIVVVDPDGEVITAYIFADNYFELYVNGAPIGKDPVPFTKFNSNIVKFKVSRPFTVAMLLVDWEENLGLGTERNRRVSHHPGDGGMVAVFKDQNQKTIAITGDKWKAQTFYTSPIADLSCVSEDGAKRNSARCSTKGTDDGDMFYGLHWQIPSDWMKPSFDDSRWPSATTYTNATIGVKNKKSYTNFSDIFDDPAHDAEFIWSTNVVLDNEVIVRFKVK